MKSIKSLDMRVKVNLMGGADLIGSAHYTVVGRPAIGPQSIVGIVVL